MAGEGLLDLRSVESWVRDVAYVSTDHMVGAAGLEPTTSAV